MRKSMSMLIMSSVNFSKDYKWLLQIISRSLRWTSAWMSLAMLLKHFSWN